MKKLILLSTALLLVGILSAQPRGTHHNSTTPTPSILIQAQQNETFQVYVNGDLINNIPKSEVLVNNLDTRLHEVVVILSHPAHTSYPILSVLSFLIPTPPLHARTGHSLRPMG